MQQRFLPLYEQLRGADPASSQPIQGFWLIHSDEPLISQWLIDACRPIWQAHEQTIKRIELTSAKSWTNVIAELDSLSLFGDASAIIVSGNHKPDKDTLDALARIAPGTLHHLLWQTPKQDKKSLSTKAIRLFDQLGLIIDGNIYDERMRGELLKMQARHIGVTLNADAWQMLMMHTEHNLLTAHQNLWRLSLLYPNATIDIDMLTTCLVDGAEFSVFDLSDTVLAGNTPKALQILNHLKNTDTAPSIILWALAKDARLILQIQAGKNPSDLGIWRNKISSYTNASRRSPTTTSQSWLSAIYDIDKTIKGVDDGNVWHLLQQLVLSLCGTSMRSNQFTTP